MRAYMYVRIYVCRLVLAFGVSKANLPVGCTMNDAMLGHPAGSFCRCEFGIVTRLAEGERQLDAKFENRAL